MTAASLLRTKSVPAETSSSPTHHGNNGSNRLYCRMPPGKRCSSDVMMSWLCNWADNRGGSATSV